MPRLLARLGLALVPAVAGLLAACGTPGGRAAADAMLSAPIGYARAVAGAARRLVSDRLDDLEISPRDFGPTGTVCVSGSDDTVAVGRAVTAATLLGGARGAVVKLPRAACSVASLPQIPARKCVLFRGEGMGASILRVTGSSANGLDWNNDDFLTACGGAEDLSLEAGAGFQASGSFAPGSTGIAVRAAHMNNGWGLRNVDISGFGTCVAYLGSWNTASSNVHCRFFSDTGILIDKGPDGKTAGGNKLFGSTISNNGYAGIPGTIGIRLRASGGEWFSDNDITGVDRGVVADPRAGDQVAYQFWSRVTSDTSLGDAFTLDASQGYITRFFCDGCWGAYSGNPQYYDGSGPTKPLATAAHGGNGLVTKGPNLQGVHLPNFAARENGLRGWYHLGGTDIDISSPAIHQNSQLADNTYPGIEVADGQGSLALMGGSIGNRQSGLTNRQAEAIKFAGAASSVRIQGVDLTLSGPGKTPITIPDETKLTASKILGNLPVATWGVNPSERMTEVIGGYMAAGADAPVGAKTAYFEPKGVYPNARTIPFQFGKPVAVRKVALAVNSAPGAGESFTYRFVVNGIPVGPTAVISGSNSYVATLDPGVTLTADDDCEVMVTGSAGAGAAVHRGRIVAEP